MKTRLMIAASAMVIASTTFATGTATAAPAMTSPGPQTAHTAQGPGIHYTSKVEGKSVILSTRDGSFVKSGNKIGIADGKGRVAAEIPLTYQLNNAAYPIISAISGKTLRLTPVTAKSAGVRATDFPRQQAVSKEAAAQQVAAQTPQAALATLVQQLTVGSIVGSMIGTIVGAGVGCIGGLIVGTVATAPVAWLLGAGPLAGCVGGAVLLAPVGTLAGTIAIGGPVVGGALFQYFSTMLAPKR